MSKPRNTSVTRQDKNIRTLIIGVGETGCMTIERMSSGKSDMPGNPIVAVDDDPQKLGKEFEGIVVKGTCDDVPKLVDEFDISQIVVAIPSATREQRSRIYDICLKTDVRVLTVPPSLLGTPVKAIKKSQLNK